MRFIAATSVLSLALAAAGCQTPVAPGPESGISVGQGAQDLQGVQTRATGGGHYTIPGGIDLGFSFSALMLPNGRAEGNFRHHGVADGELIDFKAEVTCLSVDAVNHRAWIGGVITENRSTHPQFMTAVHQVGHDIWFRVQDNGPGRPMRPPMSPRLSVSKPWRSRLRSSIAPRSRGERTTSGRWRATSQSHPRPDVDGQRTNLPVRRIRFRPREWRDATMGRVGRHSSQWSVRRSIRTIELIALDYGVVVAFCSSSIFSRSRAENPAISASLAPDALIAARSCSSVNWDARRENQRACSTGTLLIPPYPS